MARSYSISDRTPAAATGTAYCSIRTPAGDRCRVRAVEFFLSGAKASSIGLIRALTTGTASTSKLGQAHEPNDVASTINMDTAWSVAPTIAVSPLYLHRWSLPATIGVGIVYVFPEPIVLSV